MMIRLALFLTLAVSTSYAQDFYSRVRNFSIELIHFTQIETRGNVVLAPFCLWSLLSQVAYETEHLTRSQLFRSLILNNNDKTYSNELRFLTAKLKDKSDGATLINDNFVILDKPMNLSSNFVTRMRFIGANIMRLDFKDSTSTRLSNILTKTTNNQQIPSIFGDSDFIDSQMIMGNVFFFKGTWSKPFNSSNTFLTSAYDQNGSPIGNYNIMSQETEIPQSDIEELEAFVSELPFGDDGKFCMLIINPYQDVTVNKVYRHLSQVTLNKIFDKLEKDVLEFGLKNVTLKLPRFEIQSFLVLNKPLNDMGVYDAFSPNKASLLSLSPEDLYIDAIEQRTKISITEEGIEAFSTMPANLAEATGSSVITGSPFIFFVVNKPTMTIVLGGINGRT